MGSWRSSEVGAIPGEVVEWLMAPVLKTGDPQGSVGSNPTLSVSRRKTGIPKISCDVPTEPQTRCTAVGLLLCERLVRSRQNLGQQNIWVVSLGSWL